MSSKEPGTELYEELKKERQEEGKGRGEMDSPGLAGLLPGLAVGAGPSPLRMSGPRVSRHRHQEQFLSCPPPRWNRA